MLIRYAPLLHQIADKISIWFLFLFVTHLVHDILFVMPDRVLLLFHFVSPSFSSSYYYYYYYYGRRDSLVGTMNIIRVGIWIYYLYYLDRFPVGENIFLFCNKPRTILRTTQPPNILANGTDCNEWYLCVLCQYQINNDSHSAVFVKFCAEM